MQTSLVLACLLVSVLPVTADVFGPDRQGAWISGVDKDGDGSERFSTLYVDDQRANVMVFKRDTAALQRLAVSAKMPDATIQDGWIVHSRQEVPVEAAPDGGMAVISRGSCLEVVVDGRTFPLHRAARTTSSKVDQEEVEAWRAAPLPADLDSQWVSVIVHDMTGYGQPRYQLSRLSLNDGGTFGVNVYTPLIDQAGDLLGYGLLARTRGSIDPQAGLMLNEAVEIHSPGAGMVENKRPASQSGVFFDAAEGQLVTLTRSPDGTGFLTRWSSSCRVDEHANTP